MVRDKKTGNLRDVTPKDKPKPKQHKKIKSYRGGINFGT